MKNTNLARKLLACILAVAMLFGTCTTFAAITEDDVIAAYDTAKVEIEAAYDAVKGEIDEVIDIVESQDDAAAVLKVEEYINAAKEALVEIGYDADEIAEVEALLRAEAADIVIAYELKDNDAAKAKIEEYYANAKAVLVEKTDLTDADVDEIAAKIEAEVEEIIEIVNNKDDAAAIAKAEAYVEYVKATLGITDEDIAEATALIAEIIAEVEALIEEIKAIDYDAVKAELIAEVEAKIEELNAAIVLEFRKLGHENYKVTEDSYYVAIGGDTVAGTGISRTDKGYFDLIAEENEIDYKAISKEMLLPVEVVSLIENNAAEIKKADLITYQLDASSIIYAALTGDADWSLYFDEDVMAAIWEAIDTALAEDYASLGTDAANDLAAEVKNIAVTEFGADADVVDEAINAVIPVVVDVLDYVQAKVDVAEDFSIEEPVKTYAEKLAFAVVSFVAESAKAVEAIQTINPDATLVVIGMYNPLSGLEIVIGDETIDAGMFFEYAIDATNVYYAALSALNGNIAFVDVSDIETNGFAAPIDATNLDVSALAELILRAADSMHASADGHKAISEKVAVALVCDYCVYEAIDAEYHWVKCIMCGDAYKEAHTFSGDVCTLCGYTKPVVEEPKEEEKDKPSRFGGGGGGGFSQFTIKFETNGGSPVANVLVKKGEVLVAPADPTKVGFKFDGWYTDKELTAKYDFSKPVTSSFTLYAKWVDLLSLFTDLDPEAWYYEYVKAVVAKGLMNGVSETLFAPEGTLTRGMFVTILQRVEGKPATEGEIAFTDVPATEYYAEAVKWASANGIVNGISETEFAPNADVTREQMAAMLARFVDYKKIEVPAEGEVAYTDAELVSEYAKDAVVTANKLGVLIGNADGSFAPQNNAKRAEAAALFVRLLGILEK